MGSMFSQRLSVQGQLHAVTSALNFSTASDSHAEDECQTKTHDPNDRHELWLKPFLTESIPNRHIMLYLLFIPNYIKTFTSNIYKLSTQSSCIYSFFHEQIQISCNSEWKVSDLSGGTGTGMWDCVPVLLVKKGHFRHSWKKGISFSWIHPPEHFRVAIWSTI